MWKTTIVRIENCLVVSPPLKHIDANQPIILNIWERSKMHFRKYTNQTTNRSMPGYTPCSLAIAGLPSGIHDQQWTPGYHRPIPRWIHHSSGKPPKPCPPSNSTGTGGRASDGRLALNRGSVCSSCLKMVNDGA